MIKVAVIGVMTVLLAIPLKKDKPEFGMLLVLTGCLLILGLSFGELGEILSWIDKIKKELGEAELYVGVLVKMLGITYVAEFGSNLCKDAGYAAIAGQIEFFGKLLILAVSIPIFMTLLETIGKI